MWTQPYEKRIQKGDECMIYEKYLLDVNDVGMLLHCSNSHAYRVIRDLNKELAKGGYLVVAGNSESLFGAEIIWIKRIRKGELSDGI